MDPTAPASQEPVVAKKQPEKCTWCLFKSVDEGRLKTHIREKHHQCDICDIAFKTPVSLREHLRQRHGKKNGTAISCDECNFSALNQVHLRKHKNKHHKVRQCGQGQNQTSSEYDLDSHTAKQHKTKRMVTCRYWKAGTCRNQSCAYLREIVMCRYGTRCSRGTYCRFGHPDATANQRQNVNPWINPAFTSNVSYEKEFPFLGQRPADQCQCQVRGRGF